VNRADAMSDEHKLRAIRERVDALDEQIQRLISERAAAAAEIARIKLASGDECVYYRPEREAIVLRRVKTRNQGPLADEDMVRLFREIMSACLALQQPLRVAYLGPQGTFTQQAALKHFGQFVRSVPLPAIDEVFREVESGNAHYGVVPVENSTEGVVSHTLDTFLHSTLKIWGEVELRIHHHLMAGTQRQGAIRKVYAHQQSLAQCREWLDRNLPRIERLAVSSNAEAARLASDEEGAGAIAGETAAELHRLHVLARCIEDEPDNTTRFLVIGHEGVPPTGSDKTTLLLSVHNEPGALYELLEPLARNGISMTRIESRPSRRGMWDYVFFVDIEGHRQDPQVADTLKLLGAKASMFKILGSYPCAVL
jgi:chorismate mutase/prephenate dehydratase